MKNVSSIVSRTVAFKTYTKLHLKLDEPKKIFVLKFAVKKLLTHEFLKKNNRKSKFKIFERIEFSRQKIIENSKFTAEKQFGKTRTLERHTRPPIKA